MNPFFIWLIKSSISLALLYVVFKLSLSRDKMHTANRFVLLGILLTSVILPFADIPVFSETQVIPQFEVIHELVTAPVLSEPVVYAQNIPVSEAVTAKAPFNPWLIFYLVVIGLLVVRLVFSVVRVGQIIRRAEKQKFRDVILAIVKDFIQPFSFLQHIILSEKDFTENKDIVVTHEYAHIEHKHAVDLMICELFTALYWFNPFMWLLRRDLKLVHEYQADQAVLNKGIDAQKYQLLVLEKAVGERRFAMANYFTQKPILKRLKMMKKTKHRSWGMVKLILFVPLIALLLQAFARPELITKSADFIPVRYMEDNAEQWLTKWNLDNIGDGIFDPDIDRDKLSEKENNVLVILMNKNDEYLIEGERKLKGEVKQIVKDFLHGINPHGKNGPDYAEKDISGIGKIKVSEGIISYRHDVESSKEMINYTLQSIGEACFEVRTEKAQILFGKDYSGLDEEKQAAVDRAVPVWFSFESPKGLKKRNKLSFDEEQKRAQVDLELAKAESNIFKNVGGISFEEEQNKARIDQALVNSNSVVIADEVELLIPEGFSPNGDGIHDFFEIKGIYQQNSNAKLMVFDEQGKKVFEQENYGNSNVWGKGNEWWDGTSENDKLSAGNYNYKLELGNGVVKKGTVMLALSPPPPPPLFRVKMYENRITIWDYTIKTAPEDVQNFEVKKKAKEFLERAGENYMVSIFVYENVSEDRIDQMKELLGKTGMKYIKVRKI